MSIATGKHRHAAIDTVLGPDKLLLKSMSGREELGRLFDYNLVLIDPNKDVDPDKLVGTNVTVRLQIEGAKTRYFNGYIASLAFLGYEENAGVYHAQMVPWLWMLSRSSDCRIFQNLKTEEILKDVFGKFGFEDYRFQLSGSYKPRVFCVQYNETALNYVSRLMEHDGMYYMWEHENGKHIMVIKDDMAKHQPHPDKPTIQWRERTGLLGEGFLYDLRVQKTVSSGAFAMADFNFKKPKQEMRADLKKEKKHAAAMFEHYEYPGVYREIGDGKSLAKVRLEEAQTGYESIDAMVTAGAIACGYKFQLTKGERKDQERGYLVTSTVLTISVDAYGTGGGSGHKYECHITAIPDTNVFRPARISPKPLIRGPQTALVVGPSGEEIHCDEHGRVKLHFYWDRYSKADDKSSKWVRVSHPSAGGGYGFMSLPRIGQEVVVEFLNGDPDQPLITGRVYNGENTPPYSLPADKTRTIWKSNSSKGGGGFNEIRFEDKKGSEQIFMHGQKDMDVRVKNVRKEFTGASQHLVVGGDQVEKVGKDLHQEIEGSHKESIKKDHHLDVGGNDLNNVKNAWQVTAGQDVRIESGTDTEINTAQATSIVSGMSVVVEAMNITLKGAGGFITIGPSGVTIQGTMVLINSGGAAGPKKAVAKKPLDKPKKAAMADDSKAGKVEKSKGMGHASKPGTWKKQTVQDLAAQSGAPFYSR
jgi:type VI secretion system secreted protein VgrG